MANPLEMLSSPPPAPLPSSPQDGLQQGGGMPQGGAPQQQAPPPSHEQTVAAVRHFHAVTDEIQALLKDPAAGKSDLKSKIIDGVTKLVSERMIAPAQAVLQLAQVPDDPIKQRQWLAGMLQQATQAANDVVDHHAGAMPGSLDWGLESKAAHPHADKHMQLMDELGAQYGRR